MDESRLCIEPVDDQINWRFENMSYIQIREVCQRLGVYLRFMDMGLPLTQTPVSGVGNMISIMHYPDMPEVKICVVMHPLTGAIQASISGTTLFSAGVLCDEIIRFLNHRICNGPTE